MLAFAAIQPTLCATAHHMLCLLLVVVAADWAASLLTSHVLLVVFSSGQEMFQIVVALLVEAGTPLLQCLSVMFLFFFFNLHAAIKFLQHGCCQIGSLAQHKGVCIDGLTQVVLLHYGWQCLVVRTFTLYTRAVFHNV